MSDTRRDLVTVPKARLKELDALADEVLNACDELDTIRRETGQLAKHMAQLSGFRATAFALKRVIAEIDPDKTPLRPPSSDAISAFKKSSEFLSPVSPEVKAAGARKPPQGSGRYHRSDTKK